MRRGWPGAEVLRRRVQYFAVCHGDWTRMNQRSEHSRKPEAIRPGEQRDESLRRLRSRFSRRLESFGLGESQSPLLTDRVESVDANGNAR